jgi:hypothetical protein
MPGGAMWLPQANQYYASSRWAARVEFSTVEVASEADTVETFGAALGALLLLPWGPTSAGRGLELRLLTELRRGRPDRYEPLIAHLRQRGCDAGSPAPRAGRWRAATARQEELLTSSPDASAPRREAARGTNSPRACSFCGWLAAGPQQPERAPWPMSASCRERRRVAGAGIGALGWRPA